MNWLQLFVAELRREFILVFRYPFELVSRLIWNLGFALMIFFGFQAVGGNGSTLIRPRVAPIDEVLAASRFGAPHLVGNAAKILADRWPTEALPPVQVDPQPAPDISWVAWLGAAVSPNTAPARPYYLRAPDAKPATEHKTAQLSAS